MAHVATTWSGPARSGAGVFERVRQWRALRARMEQTRLELQALSDRDLADLGISRTDIPAIAREAVGVE